MLGAVHRRSPWVTMSFVDSGYQGDEAQRAADEASRISITVVKRTDTTVKGFVVLPKRWVVERTLGWINRARRLSKDFEATIKFARVAPIGPRFPPHAKDCAEKRGHLNFEFGLQKVGPKVALAPVAEPLRFRRRRSCRSKYPPAKPGALRLGAPQRGQGAQFPAFDDRRIQACLWTLDHAVGIAAPLVRSCALAQNQRARFQGFAFLMTATSGRAYRRICQTSTASPAKPGDLP